MPTKKLRKSGVLLMLKTVHTDIHSQSGAGTSVFQVVLLGPWQGRPSCFSGLPVCVVCRLAIRLHPPHHSQTLRPRVLLTAPLSQETASVQLLKMSFEPVGNSPLLQSVPFCLQALSGPRAGLLSLFCAPSFPVVSWVGGLPGSALGLLEMRSLIQ
ncbi:hypothetical protein HJG60_009943 [Phyllostomus discolor]|uniref:Uncharacterized protein n=1 Tax=Phyllostomus discolor TaxID=89673 RepID=A0A834EQM9_9CHIR|nr:hypothetical protein HJG60_009943 [Phyllostomus discolor]